MGTQTLSLSGLPSTNDVAINCGGNAATYDGRIYFDDMFFTGGGSYSATDTPGYAGELSGTPFEAERNNVASTFTYSIPVKAGRYSVELGFAEIFHDSAGSRVFDVLVEGQTVLSGLDVFVAAGGRFIPYIYVPPIDYEFATDATIDISFVQLTDFYKISSVAVRELQPEETVVSRVDFSVSNNSMYLNLFVV